LARSATPTSSRATRSIRTSTSLWNPRNLQALKLESSKTIELVKFVDASDLDRRYFERPYYLGPGNETSGEGWVVIRDALRKTGKVGLGQMTIGGREWLVAVTPLEDGLAMIMLRYADELRDAAPFFDEVPTAKPDSSPRNSRTITLRL